MLFNGKISPSASAATATTTTKPSDGGEDTKMRGPREEPDELDSTAAVAALADEATEEETTVDSSKNSSTKDDDEEKKDDEDEQSFSSGIDASVTANSMITEDTSTAAAENKTEAWGLFKQLARLQSQELGELEKSGGVTSLDDLLNLGLDPDLAKQMYKEAELNPMMITRLTALLRCMTGFGGGDKDQKKLKGGEGVGGEETEKKKTATATTASSEDNTNHSRTSASTTLSMAEDGLQAIRDLKRMLCFTFEDSEISPELLNAAKALDDLDRVLTEKSFADDVLNLTGTTTTTTSKPSTSGGEKPDKCFYSKQFSKPKLVVWNSDKGRYEWNRSSSLVGATPTGEETKMSDEDALAASDTSSAMFRLMELLATNGQAAMESAKAHCKEAERVLFFTDLPDKYPDDVGTITSQEDNPALLQLKEIMSDLESEFTKRLAVAAEQTHEAYKEAERVVFFTDLPDKNDNSALVSLEDIPGLSQLKEVLSQAELAFAKHLVAAGEQTYQACKDVERTLLFTDVPDNNLIYAPALTKEIKSRGVMADLERQFLFTDVM